MKFKRIVTLLTVMLVAIAAVALAPGSASAVPTGWRWLIGNESGKCLTVHGSPPYVNGADIDIYTCVTPIQDNQLWAPASYTISGVTLWYLQSKTAVSKALTVRGAGTANGTALELWSIGAGSIPDNQLWFADNTPYSNTYYFRGFQSNKCVTVHGGGSVNNTPVDIWTCVNQTNQMWYVA